MNIFYLDENPIKAAQAHYDKHVRKMILESAQMLSTAHRVLDGYPEVKLNKAGSKMTIWTLKGDSNEELYKSTHVNHPCNLWIRESRENYKYLYNLFLGLLNEYTYRWGKVHATQRLVSTLRVYPTNLPDVPATPFKIATTSTEFTDPVEAYRSYYVNDKLDLFAFTKREVPSWLESREKWVEKLNSKENA